MLQIDRTREPNFEQFRATILCQKADYVPLIELAVHKDIKAKILGREMVTVKDNIEFWYKAGYDYAILPIRIDWTPQKKLQERFSWASEGKGFITTREEFENYPWPQIEEFDFSYLKEAEKYLPKGMGVIFQQGDIFTQVWNLMGFTEFSYALVENEELIKAMFEKIGGIITYCFEEAIKYPVVKCLWYSDDLAYTGGLLVQPEVYRKYLWQFVRRISEAARKINGPFIYHTDGVLYEIFDDFIEMGVNAIHPIEPKSMNILEVKKVVGNKLCLCGHLEMDFPLTRGKPEDVAEEAKRLMKLMAPYGGYCLGSSNTIPDYVPLENYIAMVNTNHKYGKLPIRF